MKNNKMDFSKELSELTEVLRERNEESDNIDSQLHAIEKTIRDIKFNFNYSHKISDPDGNKDSIYTILWSRPNRSEVYELRLKKQGVANAHDYSYHYSKVGNYQKKLMLKEMGKFISGMTRAAKELII